MIGIVTGDASMTGGMTRVSMIGGENAEIRTIGETEMRTGIDGVEGMTEDMMIGATRNGHVTEDMTIEADTMIGMVTTIGEGVMTTGTDMEVFAGSEKQHRPPSPESVTSLQDQGALRGVRHHPTPLWFAAYRKERLSRWSGLIFFTEPLLSVLAFRLDLTRFLFYHILSRL